MAQNNRVSISVAAFSGVNVVCGYSHSPMKGCALPYPELRLSIKLAQIGVSTPQICESLGISPQYVSKWKHRFQNEGVVCLRVAYRGSQSFLTDAQREVVLAWIGQHESLRLEELCSYLEVNYGIT
ncbi:helix-turn-helix domain-containing protein [Thiothrix subterranea]|uniref:helix-turn-helix domain-containing protein n=1 Tax=Thiothrix subterranea TaxID=2735563 RepID=UPI002B1BCF05|nr:helix-turn-helix domain-containing protein [Thiothrix subterranea]